MQHEARWPTSMVVNVPERAFESEPTASVLVLALPIEHLEGVAAARMIGDQAIGPSLGLSLPEETVALQSVLVGRAILTLVPGDEEPDPVQSLRLKDTGMKGHVSGIEHLPQLGPRVDLASDEIILRTALRGNARRLPYASAPEALQHRD